MGTFFRQKSIFPWDLDDVFIVASIPSRRGDQLLHCEVAGKRGIFGLFSLFFYKFRWVNKMPSALYFLLYKFLLFVFALGLFVCSEKTKFDAGI